MPPLANLSFAGLDDSVYRPTTNKTNASASQVEASTTQTSNTSVEMPRVESIRPILTRFRRVPVSAAKQSSFRAATSTGAVRQVNTTTQQVNTATHTNRVNVSKLKTNAFHKSHSPIRRPFYKSTTPNTRISNEKVDTVRVNGVNTAGQTAVSTVKGNGVTAVKASTGNPQQALKNKGIFDSGCSRHMTGNKAFLTDYQDIDGSFVAFGGSTRGGKITGKGKIRTYKLAFEDVCFVKELNFDLKNVVPSGDLNCLFAKATIDESKLWHRRLGHVNFKTMNKLVKGNLVRGLPSNIFDNDHTCVAFQKGKQHKASYKTKLVSSISQPLQMLHMDLFCPTSARSINHKTYCLVVTDEFSRDRKPIKTEFKNREKNEFCRLKGIKREFSVVRTPQQNGVAERKNMTLIEATRTMLADSLLPTVFWAEAVNTACYVLNRVLVTKPHIKTPYELIIGVPPSISSMTPFGCPVTILNTLGPLGKFDGNVGEGFLVGYYVNIKVFKVFNSQTRKVKENLHVNFLENKPNIAEQGPNWLFDIDSLTNSINYQPVTAGNQTNNNADPQEANGNTCLKKSVDAKPYEEKDVSTQQYIKEATEQSDAVRKEFEAQCNRELLQGKATGASSTNSFNIVSTPVNAASTPRTSSDAGPSFIPLSGSFPLNVNDFLDDPLMPDLEDIAEVQNTGIFGSAYDDDLDTCNSPYADQVMGAEADSNNMEPSTFEPTKIAQALDDESWVKAMQEELLQFKIQKLVAQGYKQKEGIDYDEVFAPVDRIEAIRLFLAYASFMNFLVYQMNVKSAFLYGTTEEEMSSMGELTFFLGLHVKQKEDGIFISQDKYVGEILKKFGFSSIRTASTPIETNKALTKDEDGEDVDVHLYRSMIESLMYLTSSRPDIMLSVCACSRFQVQPKVSHLNAVKRIFRYLKGRPNLGLWYPKDSPFILEAFLDSDYAVSSWDRKSTIGGCQFLGLRLISWQCKKQTVTKIHVDNKSAICVVKNPVYHSKTKHIEIRHHFIRDSYEKRLIEMVKIHTDNKVADLLTKAFDGWLMVYKGSTRALTLKLISQGIVLLESQQYVRRFQELATLCPTMVPDFEKMMEVFIGGLPRSIEGNVTASKPQTLEEAINIA
ncbi:putative ribonuclease H-like domain-containing protein [Tanacetum coccineum]